MITCSMPAIAHDVGELFVASSSEVYQTPPESADGTKQWSPLHPRPTQPPLFDGGETHQRTAHDNCGRKKLRRAVIFRSAQCLRQTWAGSMSFLNLVRGCMSFARRRGTINVPIKSLPAIIRQ